MENKLYKISVVHVVKCITILLIALAITACSSPSISTSKPNRSPVIESISYAKDSMAMADNEIGCRASDPDGDNLLYEWSADGGQITVTGPNALWIAPGVMGNYIVSVMVKDGKGGEAIEKVDIRVLTNADGTTAMPITLNMRMLMTDIVSENATVKVGTMTKVTCAIENAAGKKISYAWTATGGKIKGIGLEEQSCTNVYWTAPPETKIYDLSVTAKDTDGNEARGKVAFDVFCCPRN